MADPGHDSPEAGALPSEPIDRILAPIARFLHVEAAGGIALLTCTALALGLANSDLADPYLGLWKTSVGFRFGPIEMVHSLKHWISDGLMGVFFFVIGLEVKRELVLGELRDLRRAALPIAAALGGMVVPAGLFLALQAGEPGARGWGIPMATDIAFAVGCLAVLGPRVPRALRVLLLSLAIADDIGAILVIAFGYTEVIHATPLVLAFLGLGGILALARVGVRAIGVYVVVGTGVWLAFHESGIHATIAGVLVGLITPSEARVPPAELSRTADRITRYLKGESWTSAGQRHAALRHLETAARETLSPLERVETSLHPWVSFGIMPIFALANAGVSIQLSYFVDPVALAIGAGLVIGKPLGILLAAGIAVRLGLAELPQGVGWTSVLGAGCLAGIGFTMAIFIAGLALEPPLLDAAKVGVLGASTLAALLGLGILIAAAPHAPAAAPAPH